MDGLHEYTIGDDQAPNVGASSEPGRATGASVGGDCSSSSCGEQLATTESRFGAGIRFRGDETELLQ